jgi:hypothetical protein
MTVTVDDVVPSSGQAGTLRPVVAAHRFVSCHAARLFTRDQAITAMVIAERRAAGYGDDDPFMARGRENTDQAAAVRDADAICPDNRDMPAYCALEEHSARAEGKAA